jgi:tetratricopeptide (TPR) repeat protein
MSQPLGETINSAFVHHQNGDLDSAEAMYRLVLGEDRDNINALHLLGVLMHHRGAALEAVAHLQDAIAVLERRGDAVADHAAIYNSFGNALKATGRGEDARACYRRGLDLNPGSAELHANLGSSLLADGDLAGAAASYQATLKLIPEHVGAIANLACILIEQGALTEALVLCRQLVGTVPEDANAQFLLGRTLGALGDNFGAIVALRQCLKLDGQHHDALYWLGTILAKVGMTDLAVALLERAIMVQPDDASAYVELGNVLQGLGETARAFACFRRLGELRPLTTWPATRSPAPFSVLAIASPGIANTPPDFLFANAEFDSHFFALLPDLEPDSELLRRHGDIVVNLISDADQGRAMLTTAADLIDRLGKRTINHPRRILDTDRETVASALSGIGQCHAPQTVRVARNELAAPDAAAALQRRGFAFPLLLRMAGTHGGEAFEKIDAPDQIASFIAAHAADAFYVTSYADYQSADGYFRKYRFVVTDRDILPYHLAIGDSWKVHHFTTDMSLHAWMQDEEKAFLQDPGGVFSPAHYAVMAAVRDAVGLDFFGIDCSLDRDGGLLVFEVNCSILIHDDNAEFPYKNPACIRIKRAFAAMLGRAAASARSA